MANYSLSYRPALLCAYSVFFKAMQSLCSSLRFYATHCLCVSERCLQCLRYAFHLFAIVGPINATLCLCDALPFLATPSHTLLCLCYYSLCLTSPSLGAAVIASPLPIVAVHFRAVAMLFLASPCHRSSGLCLRFAETIQAMPLLLLAAPNFAFAAHSVSVLCRCYYSPYLASANHRDSKPLRRFTVPLQVAAPHCHCNP